MQDLSKKEALGRGQNLAQCPLFLACFSEDITKILTNVVFSPDRLLNVRLSVVRNE